MAQQGFDVFAIVRKYRDADTRGQRHLDVSKQEWFSHVGDQLVGHVGGILTGAQARQQHGEFVTADACQRVRFTQAFLQSPGHVFQQLVTL